MGNNVHQSYTFLPVKKIAASLLLLSSLACFTMPAVAQEGLAGTRLAVATPTDKADDIVEILKRALIRKKYPRLLKKENQVSQERRQELIKKKLLERRRLLSSQAESKSKK